MDREPVRYASATPPAAATWVTLPTLRDRFAMAALTGIIHRHGYINGAAELASQRAYEIADSMVKARGADLSEGQP